MYSLFDHTIIRSTTTKTILVKRRKESKITDAATESLETECLGDRLPRDRVPSDRVPIDRVPSDRVRSDRVPRE